MKFPNLKQWLDWLNGLHISAVDLVPGRFTKVANKLAITQPSCPVVTVAGTNGKGSVVAMLESILVEQGCRVGAYTSPYIFSFNEQIRLSGKFIEDGELCEFFEKIEQARGEIPLTMFEFKTLAAFLFFESHTPDVMLLEVGLGGRLDPVNYMDATIAIITSIGLDHCDRLGDTREQIAKEKAGILRENQKVVCGDLDPPTAIFSVANALNAQVYYQKKDFDYLERKEGAWDWYFGDKTLEKLPVPHLLLQNCATTLMVIELLQNYLEISELAIRKGLLKVNLPGRQQIINEKPVVIVDVAHNEDSVQQLAAYLEKQTCHGKTYAIFSMLKSKDIVKVIEIIKHQVDVWLVTAMPHYQSISVNELWHILKDATHAECVNMYPSVNNALIEARHMAGPDDRIVIFGSFYLVADVLAPLTV